MSSMSERLDAVVFVVDDADVETARRVDDE